MTPNHLFNQTNETQNAEEAHRAERNNQNMNVDITTIQPILNRELAASQPSATYQVLERIAAKSNAGEKNTGEKNTGEKVLSLCAGEPDFDTPSHIADAAVTAIRQGKTRYTPVAGLQALRVAVADKFTRENEIPTEWQNTLMASGGKQVIFNALAATLNAGDEVIIPAPFWVSYPEIVQLCGATSRIVQCDAQSHFKLTPAALEAAINDNSRWLILNSPSNPTGAVYSKNELCALAEVLEKHPNLLVLCDDIYEHLVFDNQAFYTLAQVAPTLRHRVLTMNGASKGYAMTGWRIGYCTGPNWLIAAMTKLQGQQTSGASSISQYAALAALTGPQEFLSQARASYTERRDQLVARINDITGLHCTTPQGAFYVFVDCSDWIGKTTLAGETLRSDKNIVDALLDEANVGVMHGSAFGLGPYLRISYAVSPSDIDAACDALKHFAHSLRD